jgi:hypothetical protein
MSLLYSRHWVMTSRNALEGARQRFALMLAPRDIPSTSMADRVRYFMRGAFEQLPSPLAGRVWVGVQDAWRMLVTLGPCLRSAAVGSSHAGGTCSVS